MGQSSAGTDVCMLAQVCSQGTVSFICCAQMHSLLGRPFSWYMFLEVEFTVVAEQLN
jgi:hypothetical protein